MTEPTEHLRRLRTDWERLGAADPLWAVYVSDQQRGGRWQIDDFLRTGADEVEDSWAQHQRLLGFVPPQSGWVLDFGCGVGRLSTALATRMKHVVGVDISEPMLRASAQVMPEHARARTSLVLSDSPGLPIASESMDLAYTSLVLQHMPEDLARGYLREMARVLRPGGTGIVQVAEQPDRSIKGFAFRFLPPAIYGAIQRVVLRYPAPMRMQKMSQAWVADALRATGVRIVGTWEDTSYGGHWRYTRLLFIRESGQSLR